MLVRWWLCLVCRAKYSISDCSTKRINGQKGFPNSMLYQTTWSEQIDRPQVATCAKALETGVYENAFASYSAAGVLVLFQPFYFKVLDLRLWY